MAQGRDPPFPPLIFTMVIEPLAESIRTNKLIKRITIVDYHMAVTLDQIKHWWHNSPDKQWVSTELSLTNNINWKVILLDPTGSSPCTRTFPLTIETTVKYWKSLITGNSPQSGTSQLSIPLDFVHLHIPNLSLFSWIAKGITTLDELYDGCHIKPFLALQNTYNLPASDSVYPTKTPAWQPNLKTALYPNSGGLPLTQPSIPKNQGLKSVLSLIYG